ncbi:phosphoglucosamine mutase [Selenihalanaerobacter shriftii]|uniref:Phosphoglucosamine mutase n=1 Tax=Selenihalanaerobacter shriftii TaxID=142842 RepID=A0A1T4JWF8_9FIRM|nr:phosphoglucosamine mutase [Selenihalanaerobacter shriftii]SJZ34506.1 phosphoglucosamine mutase [Selenihalanaerobacter shriftii]
MGRLFGTDGVRGVANQKLTPELVYKLGKAGTYRLTKDIKRPTILIGKDTRISGDMLEAALIAGINSIGADVLKVGVVPTPVVSYLTKKSDVDGGIMISASHNPVADNGIKFFKNDGFKLSDQIEDEIEEIIFNKLDRLPQPTGLEVGRVKELLDPLVSYLEYAKEIINIDFSGMKVVVDTANGAASELAPKVLEELGADVVALNHEPDGTNINVNSGSTHPERLQKIVIEQQADLGIAHDGDADRTIATDENGNIIDGDLIMAICGRHLIEKGELPKETIVATKYSNLGLHESLTELGGKVVTTRNGDRYVLAEMLDQGYKLGGEKSGHIIFLDYNTTGDGIMTALQLIKVMVETEKSLSELAKVMRPFPQLLVNVKVKKKGEWETNQEIQTVIKEVEAQLGNDGRVFVRASGTEPVIRVMVEGKEKAQLEELANEIADVIREELN